MKLLILFLLLFGLNANAQRNYFIEYNISTTVLSSDFLVLDNSLSVGVKMNKILFSMGVGREDWSADYFNNKNKPYTNMSLYISHCRTYKIAAMFDYQFSIPKTKLSIRVGGGAKVYFLNQMKDSLSLGSNDHVLQSLKPSALLNATDYVYPFENGLANYSFITSVPYALTTNLAVQYNFKKCALKFYFEPYWMMIKIKNAKHFTPGSNFGFYSNLGLGINYPLNFNKKEKTSPPNQ